MPFPALHTFLGREDDDVVSSMPIWTDTKGQAFGQFFRSTLTSAFQTIHSSGDGDDRLLGYEALARSHSQSGNGLCLWRLLDLAASDELSVALDRLCRVLHAINFFRQPQSERADLYLHVHARLLAAVDRNHGDTFRQALRTLDLPQERIVLQLPAVPGHKTWLLEYAAENYRRNGFRLAVNTSDIAQALHFAQRLRPEAVKVDSRHGVDQDTLLPLLGKAATCGVRVIFKRVESQATHDALARAAKLAGVPLHVQGFLLDLPSGVLPGQADIVRRRTPTESVRSAVVQA